MEVHGIPPFHGIPREVVWGGKVLLKGMFSAIYKYI